MKLDIYQCHTRGPVVRGIDLEEEDGDLDGFRWVEAERSGLIERRYRAGSRDAGESDYFAPAGAPVPKGWVGRAVTSGPVDLSHEDGTRYAVTVRVF